MLDGIKKPRTGQEGDWENAVYREGDSEGKGTSSGLDPPRDPLVGPE